MSIFYFFFSRSRGIPTHLLGHFDDHSSDNSEEKYTHIRLNNGGEGYPSSHGHTSNSNSSAGGSLGSAMPAAATFNHIHMQQQHTSATATTMNPSDEELLCNMVKEISAVDSTVIRNDITPPPGAPKLENSARLRRYRHNVD